jgi:siroheme synthase (precorrin-2 oxidase/ferrochelatase)
MNFNIRSVTAASSQPVSLTFFKRSLSLAAVSGMICMLGASFALAATPQSAACQAIKQAVQKSGKFLYRFQDPKHPDLQLYNLYVKSDLQCNVGEALEEEAVSSLDGCFVQTCVEQNDYGN